MSGALKLLGYPVSNYFNVARAVLLEKGAAFEIELVRASQEPDFLALSPMGKIPVLQTAAGPIAETVAIIEYVEELIPEPPLYPPAGYERAVARQIINVAQVYLELPARQLFPGVFFGAENAPATVDQVRLALDRAITALARLARPQPYLTGSSLGLADVFLFYTLDIADRVTRSVYDRSLIDEVSGLREWSDLVAVRPSTAIVMADFLTAFREYLDQKGAAYRLDNDARLAPPMAALQDNIPCVQ